MAQDPITIKGGGSLIISHPRIQFKKKTDKGPVGKEILLETDTTSKGRIQRVTITSGSGDKKVYLDVPIHSEDSETTIQIIFDDEDGGPKLATASQPDEQQSGK